MEKNKLMVHASETGDFSAVELLLKTGANAGFNNSVALKIALDNKHLDIVDLLIKNGATIEEGKFSAISTVLSKFKNFSATDCLAAEIEDKN